jgi:hypothetical protein
MKKKGVLYMDTTGIKGIDTSNYTIANETKKASIKSTINTDTSKIQGLPQDLGNDTFIKSTEEDTVNSTYKPEKKKLSAEEVKALNEEQENLKIDFIKKFISDTINNQNKILGKSTDIGNIEESKKTTDLLTKIFGSVEKAYPPLATTKEGAADAISEGGAYSINAVADRIMTMAKYIAGDDPAKLQQMREAVEKGFSQAGIDFSKATKSDLPQISKDTIAEVMRRFDELQGKTSITNE